MTSQPEIPQGFAKFIRDVHGSSGERWIADLPDLLAACARQWQLQLEAPFPNLTFNYVVRCRQSNGNGAVLKVGVPHRELFSEMDALEVFDGRGAARLYAADRDKAAMLIELIEPGKSLWSATDDEWATLIAARVMRDLRRPPPATKAFRHVADWGEGFARLRTRFGGGTGPIPAYLVDESEQIFSELLSESRKDVLLHGDLHHDNILDGGDGRWVAIDPKGILGPPEYEVGAWMHNPMPGLSSHADLPAILRRRLGILAEELGFDREVLRRWSLAQAVLSAWWTIDDNSGSVEPALRFAAALREIS